MRKNKNQERKMKVLLKGRKIIRKKSETIKKMKIRRKNPGEKN